MGGDDSSTPLVDTGGKDTPLVDTGGDGDAPLDDTEDGPGSNDGSTGEGDSGTGSGSNTRYKLGSGSGDTFSHGEISSDTNTLTIGSEQFGNATLTLNIVDTSKGNSLAKNSDNSVTFSSQCSVSSSKDAEDINSPWASFSLPTVSGSEGKVSTVYMPTAQCLENNDGKDIITARLNGDDDNTATFAVNLLDQASAPSVSLGSFDGNNFIDEQIGLSQETLAVGQNSGETVRLSLSLVDPSKGNQLITSKNATVTFNSACTGSGYASINPASTQFSGGKAFVSYSASLECLEANDGEDIITAKIEGQEDLKATTPITLVEKQMAIGFFNGSTFNNGQIQFSGTATAGQSTPISVSIVDLATPAPHALVKSSQNSVSYSSTCSRAGWAEFSPQSITGDDGLAPTTYVPAEACVSNNGGKDKITAKLNSSDDVIAEVDVVVVSGSSTTTSLAFGAFTTTPADPTPSFRESAISVANDNVSVGKATPISVSIVDPNNAYELVKDSGTEVSFSSVCSASDQATFNPTTVSGSEGKVLSTYTPSQACLDAGETDTIRAKLTAGDQVFTAEVLVTLQSKASAPKATLAPLQATPSSLTVGETATIGTRIIDPQSGDLIKQGDNSVSFSSICTVTGDASFNSTSVSGSEGVVYTKYTASSACLASSGGQDVITARLNGSDDVQESLSITLNPQPTTDPSIGTGDGGNFVSGNMEVSPSTDLIIGDETQGEARVTLRIVDQNNGNSPLVGLENSVSFFSACISSGWASMDNRDISTEAGTIHATYTPGPQCVGEDTLFAKLNDDGEKLAQVTFTNTPIVTPPEPVIEVGSIDDEGEFQAGIIRVMESALILDANGEASTDLLVNIQSDGQPADFDSYTAEFTSMCIDAKRASVSGSMRTESGAILATYNASPDCLGTDNVVVFLNGDSTLKASADIIVSDTELAIGSYDDTFKRGVLSAEQTVLDYNSDSEPTTDIRSAIAKVIDGKYEKLTGFQSSIEFFSTCLDSGLATIESTGSTVSGELISSYRATGCLGTDKVYARIPGTNDLASTQLKILPKKEQVLLLGHFNSGAFTDGEIGKSRTSDLPIGAQTRLYFSLVDEEDTLTPLTGQPLSVELSSTCEGVHESDSPFAATNLSLSNGYAEVLYTAQACGTVEKDIVKATLTGADGLSAEAQTSITLDKNDVAHSLTANQPKPNSIAPGEYDGTYEDRTSTSFVQFQLKNKDGNGTNLANKEISFRLDDPAVSEITLTPTVAQTDDDGFVTVTVKAKNGAPNSVFRVIATHEGLETYSAPIAVNSKLPFAERFTLGTSNFAPDTQPGKNGVQVELTVLAADVNGNRLRGNTIVNFETDQGSIDPECVLDDNGRCTVTWESLNVDDTFATIKAYTHGRLANASGQPAGTGEIQAFTNMLMSSSDNVQVLMERTSPAGGNIDPESNTYCATTWVHLPNESSKFSPPSGTEILFSLNEGEFINNASSNNSIPSSSSLLALPGYTACTKVRPTETVEEIEIPDGSGGVTIIEQTTLDIELSVTVTPPADAPLPATDYIKETYQF